MAADRDIGRGQDGLTHRVDGDGTAARLRSVAVARAEGGGLEEVGRALLDRGMIATGAAAGVVLVLADERTLGIVAASGYAEEELAPWRRVPVDAPLPVAEAVASRTTVVVGSLEELRQRYPHLPAVGDEPRALAAYPLLDGDRVVGAVGLQFDLDRDGSTGDALGSRSSAARAVVPALLTRINQLQHALDSRVVIEQAKGMLAERHGETVAQAFVRLRTAARSRGSRLHDVAAAVVAGQLDL